jgi:hypothetical protein
MNSKGALLPVMVMMYTHHQILLGWWNVGHNHNHSHSSQKLFSHSNLPCLPRGLQTLTDSFIANTPEQQVLQEANSRIACQEIPRYFGGGGNSEYSLPCSHEPITGTIIDFFNVIHRPASLSKITFRRRLDSPSSGKTHSVGCKR